VFEGRFVINKNRFVKVINNNKYKVLVLLFLDSYCFYLANSQV
jgi:hypothetical protein